MLEAHLKSPITQQRLRFGLAADHVDGFADRLHRRGYTPVPLGWDTRDVLRKAGFGGKQIDAPAESKAIFASR